MTKQQKTLSLKIIAALILAGLSYMYLYLIVELPALAACVTRFLSTGTCMRLEGTFALASLGGILGLIGLWILLLSKDFKNKAKRILVAILLIIGIMAAAFVFFSMVTIFPWEDLHGYFYAFWITFTCGLPILIITAVVFGKIRLFPKK